MSSIQYNFALNVIHLPTSRVRLLKWPVDQKFWRPMNGENDMICSVGREMRDYGTLLEAMDGLDIRCHIAANASAGKTDAWQKDLDGDGASTRKNITVGKKSYNELRDLYARSRFVVVPLLPTDTDNGTTTVLEAMAMGKAVICSRVKGQADVIQEGRTGIFVPPNDPRALHEAIEFLWNNPTEAKRMGEEARRHIEKFHTLDGWVEIVKEIVEEAIGNNTHHQISQRHNSYSVRNHATGASISS
jgi:glycosyltransferase involved in cell wall biosynthesis